MSDILRLIWKYTKEGWKSPIGRTQFILLGIETIIMALVLIFVPIPYCFLICLIFPVSEELRMRYEVAKFMFPSQMKKFIG